MKYRHFGKINQEKALLRGLALSMFKNGGIETFRNRGKDTQRFVENIITIAKKGDLASRRRVSSLMAANRDIVGEIFAIAPQFSDRVSGYTRIIRLGKRKGDATEMVRLEWVVNVKKSTTGIKGTKSIKSEEAEKPKKKLTEKVKEGASSQSLA